MFDMLIPPQKNKITNTGSCRIGAQISLRNITTNQDFSDK